MKKIKLETQSSNIEVVEMSEATKNTDEQTKAVDKAELSREEKKRLLREAISEGGRITLRDDQKEPGYHYRLCNVLPSNIENWKSMGYDVVTHKLTSGSGRIDQPEVNGKPGEIEVGGAHGPMKAIWMRTPNDNKEILDEIRDDKAREQAQMIHKNPIPEGNRASDSPLTQGTNIGKITKENLR